MRAAGYADRRQVDVQGYCCKMGYSCALLGLVLRAVSHKCFGVGAGKHGARKVGCMACETLKQARSCCCMMCGNLKPGLAGRKLVVLRPNNRLVPGLLTNSRSSADSAKVLALSQVKISVKENTHRALVSSKHASQAAHKATSSLGTRLVVTAVTSLRLITAVLACPQQTTS